MNGKIVAIKGIGGFHLVADALNEKTITELRHRKNRPQKPFALMVKDIGVAHSFCEISSIETEILSSPSAPIVLLKRREYPLIDIPKGIAPGLDKLGIFLPYAPIHHLIFAQSGLSVLIATSGNKHDEPISKDNKEALESLHNIADAFLLNDRDIIGRTDDSVGFIHKEKFILTRRSRGFVPKNIKIPVAGEPILAVGADLKGCFALTRGNEVFLSPYLGDLAYEKSVELFMEVLERYLKWLKITPSAVVRDLHPDFASTIIAEKTSDKYNIPLLCVQHHFAHGLSVMAENNLPNGKYLAISFDGYGYGSDNSIWGGEFLVMDYSSFERAGHLKIIPQPGGDIAAIDARRIALSWILKTYGDDNHLNFKELKKSFTEKDFEVLNEIIRNNKAPLTSSIGRLFDAVSCLAKICEKNSYEGECPQKLTAQFDEKIKGEYLFQTVNNVLDPSPIFAEIFKDISKENPQKTIATKFIRGLASASVALANKICKEKNISTILLSGGVFANEILLNLIENGLHRHGLKTFHNNLVPPGDDSIPLGQALFGAYSQQK